MSDEAGHEVSIQTTVHSFFAFLAFATAYAATSSDLAAAPIAELGMAGAGLTLLWSIAYHSLFYTEKGRRVSRRIEQRLTEMGS